MSSTGEDHGSDRPTSPAMIALAWLIVVIPLGYGLWQTLVKAGLLLSGG